MKSTNKSLALLPLVATIAGLSMGNTSCSSTADTSRHLKMTANVGQLDGQDFTLPSGQSVDFKYLSNILFSNQVYQHDYFIQMNAVNQVMSAVENTSTSTASSSSLKAAIKAAAPAAADAGVLSDAEMLMNYGFGPKAAATKLAHARAAVSGGTSSDNPAADVPACLYQTAQATIGGGIVSFESTGGGGVNVGFSSAGASGSATGVGGAIQINNMSLDMVVNASNDLWGRQIASIDAQKTNTSISFSIAYDMIGLNFIMNTPIASTMKADMTKALDALVQDFIKKSDAGTWASTWESRVIYAPGSADDDNLFALGVGAQGYAKVGDTFTITNMYTQWNGSPCASTLADTTIANPTLGQLTAKIIAVGQYSSIAQVVGEPAYEGNILPGAQVKILALATPAPTPTPTPSK